MSWARWSQCAQFVIRSYVFRLHTCAHVFVLSISFSLYYQKCTHLSCLCDLSSSSKTSKCLFVQPSLEWLILTRVADTYVHPKIKKKTFFVTHKFKSRQTNLMAFIVFRRSSAICYCARSNSSPLLPDNFSDIPVRRVTNRSAAGEAIYLRFLWVNSLHFTWL
jgi:hypothetical protein